MTEREYFEHLGDLAAKGLIKACQDKRTLGVRMEIEGLVSSHESGAHRSMRILTERIAQALAIAGYLTAVALAMLALSMSVECVVSGLPARLWMVYAGGALAALLLGVVAHALYDGSN